MAPVTATMDVLVLNSGSSSLKFGVYRAGEMGIETLLAGVAEAIGAGGGRFHAVQSRGERAADERCTISSHREAVEKVQALLADWGVGAPEAIGHRIVHGGPYLRAHCLLDDSVLQQLEAATPFAPLHLPPALAVVRYAQDHLPDVPQVACFDTAFHAEIPDVARILPLPRKFQAMGIQRYGFHGLSCESIMRQLGAGAPRRLVIAHLGNGASVTAVEDGKSIDTSMGMTPSGGVVMGTRSGDIDPGVLIYLLRQEKCDAATLEDLIDNRSGMLGISDLSGDMRSLHAAASSNPDARLAVEMFCYAVRKETGAMSAALNGTEMIVFTGGIGENDAAVRADICSGLTSLGVRIDGAQNVACADSIGAAASSCAVRVLPSREDEEIARHAFALLSHGR
jgi:acetate kinase